MKKGYIDIFNPITGPSVNPIFLQSTQQLPEPPTSDSFALQALNRSGQSGPLSGGPIRPDCGTGAKGFSRPGDSSLGKHPCAHPCAHLTDITPQKSKHQVTITNDDLGRVAEDPRAPESMALHCLVEGCQQPKAQGFQLPRVLVYPH